AIDRVLAAHLRPGDRVLVEDPSFPNVIDLVAALGLVAVPVAIDESSFEVEALTAALTAGARAIIITPRAQNPTGAALDEQRARVLRRVLRTAPDLLIIEDDHAARVAGVKACTLVEKNRRNWAVIRSVAKALGPDLRVAVTAGDAQTISRVRSRQRAGMRWVSGILQKMVVSLWTDPTVVRGLVRAEKTYALRRKALIDALAEHGIQASGRSGMNVWIPVREEAEPIAALQARGWAVAAGERFRIRTGPGLRVTVATLEVAEAPHLAKDIAAVV
ncbi:MAG: DNA-binding transcriptional MocR family regulator, partial [Hyphomicrobiaceae bacterium]